MFLPSLGAEATKRLPSMQLGKLVFAEVGKPGRELTMLDGYVLGSPHVRLWGFVTKSTRMVQTGTLDSAMDAAARDKHNPHIKISFLTEGEF